ncbi:hypothetical protein [Agrobacterium tumefaciens]|uniref:hypothetical protein n=1 Tax=Agrobacterium tumefaciens TaxID=358 RepID=UPI0015723A4E|nr:hypothetical protein [Agrobacterium tumefaciens]NTD10434.1 hypothetical protein [Agrobacterium tumefaciens]
MQVNAADVKCDTDDYNEARAHAWKYFELHAAQRMTLFNFFSAFSGLILAGIGTTLQVSSKYAFVTIALGLVLSLISFVFWKLDQRVSFLVKHAEEIHIEIEALTRSHFKLFTDEPEKYRLTKKSRGWFVNPWTYGQSFRLLFAAMAITGLLTAAFSSARLVGLI